MEIERGYGFENARRADGGRRVDVVEAGDALQERGLRAADGNGLDAAFQHRQIVQRVAGGENAPFLDAEMGDQAFERRPLADAFRQHVKKQFSETR